MILVEPRRFTPTRLNVAEMEITVGDQMAQALADAIAATFKVSWIIERLLVKIGEKISGLI